jgi:SAM-dependent methyltransferase
MACLIEESICPLCNLAVLDVGCRLGGITLSFARLARQVTGIDVICDWKRQEGWKEWLREKDVAKLSFANADGLALPFGADVFDLILINGVLEWVGTARVNEDPRSVQKCFLQEVRRVLKEGRCFYLAIENRLFPGYILKDPHTKIPLVGILPRRLADGVARRFYRRSYRTFTYSFWGLKKLIRESGFSSVSAFTPIYTYWFPCTLARLSDRRGILKALANLDLSDASKGYRQLAMVTSAQRSFFKLVASLGLAKVFCNAFVMTGWK